MAWIEKRKTSKGLRYYVYERVNGKRICRKAGPVHETANTIRRTLEDLVAKKEFNLIDEKKTVKQAFEDYVRNSTALGRADSTINGQEWVQKYIIEMMGDQRIATVTTEQIEKVKLEVLRFCNVNGARSFLIILKAFFQWSVGIGYIKKNPAQHVLRGMKIIAVARFLKPAEIELLLKACVAAPEHGQELANIVKVALYTGMRRGEILRATREAITDKFCLAVSETKTDVDRLVPIHSEVLPIFLRVRSGRIFNRSGNWLAHIFRRAVSRARRNYGFVGRLRFHDLRHTFCSNYLEHGGTIADLREISGHKSLGSLMIYAHFQNSYLKQKVEHVTYTVSKEETPAPTPV